MTACLLALQCSLASCAAAWHRLLPALACLPLSLKSSPTLAPYLPQVAAYLLDHERFARVPHTVMVRMTHPIFHVQQQQQLGGSSSSEAEGGDCGACEPCAAAPGLPCKLGSLQAFVPHDCDTSEMGASRFGCAGLMGRAGSVGTGRAGGVGCLLPKLLLLAEGSANM